MPARKYTPAQIDAALELREAGLTVPAIAARTGMTRSAVDWHCIRAGVDSPTTAANIHTGPGAKPYLRNGQLVRPFTPDEDARLLDLALAAPPLSTYEIARRLARPRNSVLMRLRILARREARAEGGA